MLPLLLLMVLALLNVTSPALAVSSNPLVELMVLAELSPIVKPVLAERLIPAVEVSVVPPWSMMLPELLLMFNVLN